MCNLLAVFPDRREWDLSGYTLDGLQFGFAVGLLIATADSSVSITIEAPLVLQMGTQVDLLDPEGGVLTERLLPLLHEPASSLTAFRTGLLQVTFENGAEIRVPTGSEYESWHTSGTGDLVGIGMLGSPHEGSPWGG